MEIDKTGFKQATLTDYLSYCTATVRADGKFGKDFVIKKEGVLDNIFATFSNAMLALEDKISFLCKQMNPYTAEGVFQDFLYALIGLTRNFATYTKVTRTIKGTPNTVCLQNQVVFKTESNDQFYLNSDVIIGDNGEAQGSFTAYEAGAIECNPIGSITLVSAPDGVKSIEFKEGSDVTIVGDDYEDDSEFRARWLLNQSKAGTATRGGIEAALLPLVNNDKRNLKVRQNRSKKIYDDLPLHTMNIVINTPESDETIANTIYDNIIDGVGMQGDIKVRKYDSVGTPFDIEFSRATLVEISFKVTVVILEGYYLTQVADQIQRAIFDNFKYQMGEKVVANDFYQYINSIEGVDYISELKVQKGSEGWKEFLTLKYNELPELKDLTKIQVSE